MKILNNQKQKCSIIMMGVFFLSMVAYADTLSGIPTVGENPNYMWCWCAATKSLVAYYDQAVASKTLAQVAKCYTTQDIAPPPDTIAWIIRQNGINVKLQSTWKQGKMTWAQMKKEADDKHPFIFLIRWGSPTAYYHCNVFMGYVGDSTKCYFMDPGGTGSRIYRSFDVCTSNNINNKKGYWECSFTTSLPTAIATPSMENQTTGFRIVCNSNRSSGKGVMIFSDKWMEEESVFRFFNAAGVCVYETNITDLSKRTMINIPYSFSSGMYYMVYGMENAQGLNVAGKSSFYYIK